MELSENGFNFIKNKEGCILYSYDDFDKSYPKKFITEGMAVVGTLTIGYGHTGSDVKKGMKISLDEAERLFRQDLKKFEQAVNNVVKIPLNQNQFDALVSFTFNCGKGNLETLVKGRNTDVIAIKILLYNKSKGKVSKGLINRRREEQKLFLS